MTSANGRWWVAVGLCILVGCADVTGRADGASDASPRRGGCRSNRQCPETGTCAGRERVARISDAPGRCPRDASGRDAGGICPAGRCGDAVAWWDAAPRPADAAAPVALDAVPPPPLDATGFDAARRSDASGPDASSFRDTAPSPEAGTPDAVHPDSAPAPDAATRHSDASVPAPTPPRGIYQYERLPIGGLEEARGVAFHPDGRYAVVLAYTDVVHVIDWATLSSRRFDVGPARGALYWEDLAFDPSGDRAVLVGWRAVADGREGVVFHLEDAALRAGDDPPVVETSRLPGEELAAITWPWDPGGLPVVLTRANQGRIATLREYDPAAGRFDGLVAARPSRAGCNDVAFAANELGGPGLLVVCGINGAEVLYYTEIGGFGEWRRNPGAPNLGNMARVAAHPPGDYALIVAWSGRRLLRFEAGLIDPVRDAPVFATRGIWGIAFQQEGQRALIVGRAGGDPLTGTVIEYRHPAYRCDALDCGLTEAHVPGFSVAPYNASSNTYLLDAAFRPGCDGGLIVGGETDWQRSTGVVIRFQIENGRPCR